VVQLSEYIEAMKAKEQRASSATSKTRQDVAQVSSELDRQRVKSVKDEYERQIEMMKRQHDLSVKRLNNEIEKLHSEKQALLIELENKNSNSKNQHSQLYQMTNNEYRFNATPSQTQPAAQSNRTGRSNTSPNTDSISSSSLSCGLLSSSSQATSNHNHQHNQNNETNGGEEPVIRKIKAYTAASGSHQAPASGRPTVLINDYSVELPPSVPRSRFSTNLDPRQISSQFVDNLDISPNIVTVSEIFF
jgi:hypothetical protein